MTENICEIIVLLDETGSMRGNSEKILFDLNTFISEQKKFFSSQPSLKCNFSLYTFNFQIKTIYKNTPIQDIGKFEDYFPEFSTALFDSIHKIFTENADKKNVVFVIITDGQDTCSRFVKREKIKEQIQFFERENNWKILYLSANLEAFEHSECLGLNASRISDAKSTVGQVLSQTSPAIFNFCRLSSQNIRSDLVLNDSNKQ